MATDSSAPDAERRRLAEADAGAVPWRRWGPYLSERQWGTVREDYSDDGDAWSYFTHDQARSRAYRWGEDGIAGVSDDKQRLCFALALWNGRDPLLKERMFGLTNAEGNHGEDVKEYWFHLDNTPTHSYMKYLYKYPQGEFPYGDLVTTNQARGREDLEYELLDTGVFDEDRFFIRRHPAVEAFVSQHANAGPTTDGRYLFALFGEDRLRRILSRKLDEDEFLGPHGIRSLSRYHAEHPYTFDVHGRTFGVGYLPAESDSGMFGGNSNWRGPVWFPMNILLIRALLNLHSYHGPDFTVECPTGSGRRLNLYEVAREISGRLTATFLPDTDGHRPVHGIQTVFAKDPHWKDLILFYEYFHGDNGAGLGASHQTGWTGLVAATATLFHSISEEDWHRGGRESLRPPGDREEPLS